MGGPTTWKPQGPISPGGAILAERHRLECEVADAIEDARELRYGLHLVASGEWRGVTYPSSGAQAFERVEDFAAFWAELPTEPSIRARVAELRAALSDLLQLSQVQIFLTPEREDILHRAERALINSEM